MSQPLVIIHFNHVMAAKAATHDNSHHVRCFISSIGGAKVADDSSRMFVVGGRLPRASRAIVAAEPRSARTRRGHDAKFGDASSGYPKLCIGERLAP